MTQHIETAEFDNDSLLNRPVVVTGWDQFVKYYGRYEHKTAPYLAPAVHGFFANGGSRCYVVQVIYDDQQRVLLWRQRHRLKLSNWNLGDLESIIKAFCVIGRFALRIFYLKRLGLRTPKKVMFSKGFNYSETPI